MTPKLHQGDLPADLKFGPCVAVDTETMGLHPHRDRLCLVQLSAGDGDSHLVRIPPPASGRAHAAPNLAALLGDPAVLKLFHFARFDIAALRHGLGVVAQPVYCTKTASRLVRTFTDRHGLKDLCKDLIGIELKKEQQTSDWGAPELTQEQLRYAATDVVHLQSPYNTRGTRNTRNTTDGIYNSLSAAEKAALTLRTTAATSGYNGVIDLVVRLA